MKIRINPWFISALLHIVVLTLLFTPFSIGQVVRSLTDPHEVPTRSMAHEWDFTDSKVYPSQIESLNKLIYIRMLTTSKYYNKEYSNIALEAHKATIAYFDTMYYQKELDDAEN